MDIQFLGASGEVTGSCYLLRVGGTRVLIDCGMFQGTPDAPAKNARDLPDPRLIDAVVLTHAHLDHSGRLPLLVARGYAKRVYCTPPTVALTEIILRDAARLQAEQALRAARYRPQVGSDEDPPEALFSEADVASLLRRLSVVPYDRPVKIAPGVTIRFQDAGHILGSGFVEVTCNEGPRTINVLFSGDLGERGMPLLRDPAIPTPADVALLESTYGDRNHPPLTSTLADLQTAIGEAVAQRGIMLVPAFAVGRTQTLLYELKQFLRQKLIAPFPVFLDSPMGAATTRLYITHKELFDDDARAFLAEAGNPLTFPNLTITGSVDESRALNSLKGPAMIIAGAGMCTGGRILHHLRNHVYKPTTHVIIAGYQARGTLGRRLVEREPVVRIFGQPVTVQAKVHTLNGLSAHAGQDTLTAWLRPLAPRRPRVFLTHGENPQRQALGARLEAELGVVAQKPMLDDVVTI